MSNFRKTLLPDSSVSRQPAVDYYHAYMGIMPLLNHSFPSMRSETSSHSHDQLSIRNMCMRHASSWLTGGMMTYGETRGRHIWYVGLS